MKRQDKDTLIFLGGILVVGAATGSLLGLWLSSRVLSPLIIGGVLGSITTALFFTFFMLSSLKKLYEGNGTKKDLKDAFEILVWTATSALIGVGLGFAANAMFPGVMLAMGSPALVGAVIGAIAPIIGCFATFCVIIPVAEKVNEHIISPVIEWVFSKEKEVS